MRLEPSLRYRQNLPANPPMFVMFFNRQTADGDDGMTLIGKIIDEFSSYTGMLYSCCTKVSYQSLQSETISSMRAKKVFPYGLIFFVLRLVTRSRNFCCPIVISNLVPSKKMVALCHRCNDATVLMGKR